MSKLDRLREYGKGPKLPIAEWVKKRPESIIPWEILHRVMADEGRCDCGWGAGTGKPQ